MVSIRGDGRKERKTKKTRRENVLHSTFRPILGQLSEGGLPGHGEPAHSGVGSFVVKYLSICLDLKMRAPLSVRQGLAGSGLRGSGGAVVVCDILERFSFCWVLDLCVVS